MESQRVTISWRRSSPALLDIALSNSMRPARRSAKPSPAGTAAPNPRQAGRMEPEMKKTTLVERIDNALAGQRLTYMELARRLYASDRAWRYSSNGGPPGCFMALSAGLRRGGFYIRYGRGPGEHIVYPRAPSREEEK